MQEFTAPGSVDREELEQGIRERQNKLPMFHGPYAVQLQKLSPWSSEIFPLSAALLLPFLRLMRADQSLDLLTQGFEYLLG